MSPKFSISTGAGRTCRSTIWSSAFTRLGSAPAPGAVWRASRQTLPATDGRIDLISRVTKVNDEGVVDCARGGRAPRAFTLVEILVVMVLMSLIVLALMAVFNSTQAAFRASITQTDVLEGGRSVMGLMKSDLESLTPSQGQTNITVKAGGSYVITNSMPVNFCVVTNQCQYQSNAAPLVQSLTGTFNPAALRTNVLQKFFLLTRQNTAWTGIGYVVDTTSANYFNPLYRFSMTTNASAPNMPWALYTNFLYTPFTNMSHLLDGVMCLTVRAYDPNGYWMTNHVEIYGGQFVTNWNVWYLGPAWGEADLYMFSNAVHASVEINLGVLEDRTLQRAGSLAFNTAAQMAYLSNHVGQVHLFRQRAWIHNVDPAAYQ